MSVPAWGHLPPREQQGKREAAYEGQRTSKLEALSEGTFGRTHRLVSAIALAKRGTVVYFGLLHDARVIASLDGNVRPWQGPRWQW